MNREIQKLNKKAEAYAEKMGRVKAEISKIIVGQDVVRSEEHTSELQSH